MDAEVLSGRTVVYELLTGENSHRFAKQFNMDADANGLAKVRNLVCQKS